MIITQEIWQPFAFGLLLTVILTAGLRRLLLRFGSVDLPSPDRWHRRPVARPGGPAIVAVVLAGVALFVPQPWSPFLVGWLAGGVFLFAVGLIDDLIDLSNPLKLTLLIIGAAIPVILGVTVRALPPVAGTPIAMLWILGLTNAVNWLDNMDGLAAGTSAIAAGTLMALSGGFGDQSTGFSAALVAGACIGFLYFNFSPARVFMGDSASGFLGLTLAVLALSGPTRRTADVLLTLLVPVMILSIPIFDTAIVALTRIFSGRRLFQGGSDHPSHRLVVLGMSERQAVLALWGLSALSAAAAVTASRLGTPTALVLAGVLACGFTALGLVIVRARVYDDASVPMGAAQVVLVRLVHKRVLLAIVLDTILVSVAYISAYLLRFEGTIPTQYARIIAESLPVIIGVKLTLFYALGVYRREWRYAGLLDVMTLVRAAVVASVVCVAALFLLTGLRGYSRSVFALDWVLTVGLLAGMRISIGMLEEYFASLAARGHRVLIFGAGRGGMLVVQELRSNPALACHPVGFIDDDEAKRGVFIRGIPVLGTRRDLHALVAEHRIEEVLVAVPSLTAKEIDRIVLRCHEAGVACRVVRPLFEMTDR